MPKKKTADIVRSSAAEYLTFVAATGGETDKVELRYEDENIWLTQRLGYSSSGMLDFSISSGYLLLI